MVSIPAAHIKALLLIAAHLSGYPVPPGPPPVGVELTTKEMRVFADDDTTIGMTRDNVDVVFVDAEFASIAVSHPQLGTPDENSILVHELTHWLQMKNGHGGYGCPTILTREAEAYAVQTMYEHNYEHHPNALYKAPPELYVECLGLPQ